ncbi:MAG: hypothetical protein HYY29_04615 [Chloroflexi bacterium]|nr:hypothetical protein [Chloroflexota bacterium]
MGTGVVVPPGGVACGGSVTTVVGVATTVAKDFGTAVDGGLGEAAKGLCSAGVDAVMVGVPTLLPHPAAAPKTTRATNKISDHR